jgi:hypothetical protein
MWLKVILPLLGALILFVAFIKTAIDSYAADYGETAPFGIGGVFVPGIGSIILGVVLGLLPRRHDAVGHLGWRARRGRQRRLKAAGRAPGMATGVLPTRTLLRNHGRD